MSTLDQLKKLRTAARARFTRVNNRVVKAINEDNETEYVDDIFKDLREAWSDLQNKHYDYVSQSVEDEGNEVWITKLEETCSETKKLRICAQKIADEKSIRKTKEDEICKIFEAKQQSIDTAEQSRRLEEIAFRQEAIQWEETFSAELLKCLTAGGVKLAQKEFEIQFERCKASHRKFLSLLDKESANKEIQWIVPLQKIYREVSIKFEAFLEIKNEDLTECRR
jgi:polyhydroxyalkanoate synthesis regulator phasin